MPNHWDRDGLPVLCGEHYYRCLAADEGPPVELGEHLCLEEFTVAPHFHLAGSEPCVSQMDSHCFITHQLGVPVMVIDLKGNGLAQGGIPCCAYQGVAFLVLHRGRLLLKKGEILSQSCIQLGKFHGINLRHRIKDAEEKDQE